ncbi:hypothetical protein HZB02_05020 [Candidatus Woesearchaeota archaeon]|nr:hypothetical protein [Candidatus Woesearchaeota archaeon]
MDESREEQTTTKVSNGIAWLIDQFSYMESHQGSFSRTIDTSKIEAWVQKQPKGVKDGLEVMGRTLEDIADDVALTPQEYLSCNEAYLPLKKSIEQNPRFKRYFAYHEYREGLGGKEKARIGTQFRYFIYQTIEEQRRIEENSNEKNMRLNYQRIMVEPDIFLSEATYHLRKKTEKDYPREMRELKHGEIGERTYGYEITKLVADEVLRKGGMLLRADLVIPYLLDREKRYARSGKKDEEIKEIYDLGDDRWHRGSICRIDVNLSLDTGTSKDAIEESARNMAASWREEKRSMLISGFYYRNVIGVVPAEGMTYHAIWGDNNDIFFDDGTVNVKLLASGRQAEQESDAFFLLLKNRVNELNGKKYTSSSLIP